MSQLADDYQYGFNADRNILEGVVMAQKVTHQCKKTRISRILLKLVFEKAYEIVD